MPRVSKKPVKEVDLGATKPTKRTGKKSTVVKATKGNGVTKTTKTTKTTKAPTKKRGVTKKPAHGQKFIDAEGNLALNGELLWKYRAVDAELRRSVLASTYAKEKLATKLKDCPDIVGLIEARDESVKEEAVCRKELFEVQIAIESMLNIKLSNCAIDDKTGRLFVFDEEGNQKPLAPPEKVAASV